GSDPPPGGGLGARPPRRRAPLQRLRRRPAQAPDQALGGAVPGPRVGPAPPQGLPQHRRGRHDGRPVRRDAAPRVWLLPPPLPDFPPPGLAPAAERPLPDGRLPPRDLLAVRHRLDRQQRHDQRHPPTLPGADVGPAPRWERLRPVAPRRRRPPGRGTLMTDQQTATTHPGLDALFSRPLLETIWRRRTHRVSRGSSVTAGSMSYQSSQPRLPLSELEEAVLIAITGCTGLTMPDRPFADPRNRTPIM